MIVLQLREISMLLLFTRIYYVLPCTICFASVVAAEKQHQNLLDGVEHFDKSQMKHTTTEEKNPLPPIEGLFLLLYNFLPIQCIFLFTFLCERPAASCLLLLYFYVNQYLKHHYQTDELLSF